MTTAARVARADFLRRLHSVRPGLAQRETVEQSKCVVFLDGVLATYNEEVACRAPSGLDPSLRGAVQAKKLIDLLDKLPDETVSVSFEADRLVISGRRRKMKLLLEADVLLPVAELELPESWLPLPPGFDEAAALAAGCTSGDAGKFALTCVHFHPDYVEACDNYQLARYDLRLGLEEPFLLRKEGVVAAAALGAAEVGLTASWAHFRAASGLVLSCRRYAEEYPALDDVIDFSGVPVSLPKGLAEAAQRAAICSSENPDSDRVLVELTPTRVRVTGQGITCWFQEVKDVSFAGEPMRFLISPKLLQEIIARHPECEIAEGKLRVAGSGWTYVACLSQTDAEDAEDAEGEEAGEEAGEETVA